jgi:hypothetical protein
VDVVAGMVSLAMIDGMMEDSGKEYIFREWVEENGSRYVLRFARHMNGWDGVGIMIPKSIETIGKCCFVY